MGVFWFSLVDTSHGAQVTSRSDTLNNSNVSATSNHAITFTVQNSLDNTGGSSSDTLALTFQSNFNLANITCGDVNVATGTRFLFNVASPEPRTNCPNTATSWGLLINSASRTITITVPASVRTYVATGTILTVSIGSNATYQNQGTHWIINPTDSGTKSITIGGTFGGSGQILVSVNSAVALSASIAETLTLTITGLPGERGTADKMAGCIAAGAGADDEDAVATNPVTTTAATVPFGTITPNTTTKYEGCLRLGIVTNAGNGYTISSREDHPLQTLGGQVINDTTCASGTCTPTTTGAFTAGTPGLGISCVNSATSASCSTSNPNWNVGQNWAPLSAESAGLSPAPFSGILSTTSALVLTKMKVRLAAPPSTPAGAYANHVSLIATPVY